MSEPKYSIWNTPKNQKCSWVANLRVLTGEEAERAKARVKVELKERLEAYSGRRRR